MSQLDRELGLTTKEAQTRLTQFGFNRVQENKKGLIQKFLKPLVSPISLMLLSAAFLSLLNGRKFDFYFILFLYLLNFSVQKWQEFKAGKAIQKLKEQLSFEVSVLRDQKWSLVKSEDLVPGDYIRLGLGSLIPADASVVLAENLSVNESALTGESLTQDKKSGDLVYSGSFITAGFLEAVVTQTGKNTSFGKTISAIEVSNQKSILEKDILSISRFLTIVSIASVLILSVALRLKGYEVRDLLTLDLSLVIAGIPIALPAVIAVILSIGAGGLAKKMVVVRRLSALQDLANVNLLLTDKTGTLTKNQISIARVISYQNDLSVEQVVELAYCASLTEMPDAIDQAIINKFHHFFQAAPKIKVDNFIPYDSDRKRSTVTIEKDQTKFLISMGSPQVIQVLDKKSSETIKEKVEKDILQAAQEGYRVLAIAVNKIDLEETNSQIVGLLLLADPLDESSKEIISFMNLNGIGVKILTGDHKIITERIAKELGLKGEVLDFKQTQDFLNNKTDNKISVQKQLASTAAFAGILPVDKYHLVQKAKESYVVAATGDGVNDLAALKMANVGIAVSRAVSALKGMADIVLLGDGLSVIKDAIIESRKIFIRIYNYSVYRISESFRLIITILILGLWHGFYPLLPLQLILLAFLNDIPIISLATDRVKILTAPAQIKVKERLKLSLLFGMVGTLNSLIFFVLAINYFHFSLPVIQTMFFLKLTVSGHMLIFVAHTKERWFKFLPSKQVIWATLITQAVATSLALFGFLMPAKISLSQIVFVWVWSFFWMQISEIIKRHPHKGHV